MLVALEQARITEQQLMVATEANEELKKQLSVVKDTIKLLEEQLDIYKTMLETIKILQEAKDKACMEQIAASKPSLWDNLQKYLVGGSIGGALVGVIAVLL